MADKTSPGLKILIVDDHSMVRAGLAALLQQPRYNATVLLAETVEEGLDIVRNHADIDAVLLDIVMPNTDGIAAVKDFSKTRIDLPIILLAASEDSMDVKRGLAAGALGYVPKSSSPDTLMSAIRLVLSGEIYVPPVLLRDGIPATRPSLLTERQIDVLRLLEREMSNKEIGHELKISERTVKTHITAIFKLLHASNRVEAVEYARRTMVI